MLYCGLFLVRKWPEREVDRHVNSSAQKPIAIAKHVTYSKQIVITDQANFNFEMFYQIRMV
jgi:hypothetical protein